MRNHYEVDGDVARIELGGGVPRWTTVDADVLPMLRSLGISWHSLNGYHTFYAVGWQYKGTAAKPKRVLLHRILCSTPAGLVTDHIDHDGLNNRRVNLRAVPHSVNLLNQRPRMRKAKKPAAQITLRLSGTIRMDAPKKRGRPRKSSATHHQTVKAATSRPYLRGTPWAKLAEYQDQLIARLIKRGDLKRLGRIRRHEK